ncbi:hypothetical protein [Acinetobacter schindleri]|uniref:hypothetical protein n=1 Tax=Acinetobacter schindleri TaxID=108981 RepID=UPI0021CD542F|nr:hypothetical protein [Acinetobacter schindleri]MCU4322179.1 hypothetical protein [Acinetobacter schindleri]
MDICAGVGIRISGIPIEEIVAFRTNPEFRDKFVIKIAPFSRHQGVQTRAVDSGSYEIIIEIAKGLSLGVAGNYLTEWIKYLSKKHDIKKLLIEKDEVDIQSSPSQVINRIIIKNININNGKDDGEE